MSSYRLYRLAGWLLLAVQVGLFGLLVYCHQTGVQPVVSWSWWAVCAPLYLPLLVVLLLLVFAYLLNRWYQTIYPTPEPDGTNY